MFDYFSDAFANSDIGDWYTGLTTSSGGAKPWWEDIAQFDVKQDLAPSDTSFDWGSALDYGGDWLSDYGSQFAGGPTTPDPGGNWWESLSGVGNKAADTGGSLLKGALGSKWAMPVGLGLAGALMQGSSSQSESEAAKRLREARAKGAQDYLGALETGKTEAKSSYLQNIAGQKASLLNKLGRQTADSGGANPRRVQEKFQRSANEGYGDLLLKLMQEKTADPSIYMALAEGNVPADDWWTGTKKGLASTLGTTAGTMAQYNLMQSLFGK